MRDSVVVDGVTLTREQVERAAQELDKPDVHLQTRKFTQTTFLTGHRYNVVIDNRLSGPYMNRGLFLGPVPEGYQWELIDENLGDGSRTLILRAVA